MRVEKRSTAKFRCHFTDGDDRRRDKSQSGGDAVLFVTPEYNRSVPAALKNALDVGSRPYGKNAWDGKPGAVVSASRGAIGASAQTTICGSRSCF
jgi:multimeric flavodoxin WrbA